MSDEPPEIGGLVFVKLLGSGGYSDVYLYQQQLPRRPVAVKVLKDAGLAETRRRQLTAEANAMAGLADHPNIVPVFSAELAGDGRPYIVMMYYPRPNLGIRAASERLGIAEVLRIGIQIASAIETAHRAGILHRDIKPANILTSQYGAPGLTDFGIAAQLAHVGDEEDDAGVSVPWSPPEVLYATTPASVRSDVYSLAATLWHLLVGRSPFEIVGGDNSPYALMRRVRDMPPPPTGRADVPDSLDRLLRQAMAKDPAARPASALDFALGLQAVEQAVHLQRTEVVVLTERDTRDPNTPTLPPGGDATRLRSPRTIAGQPQVEPPPNAPGLSPHGSYAGYPAQPQVPVTVGSAQPHSPIARPQVTANVQGIDTGIGTETGTGAGRTAAPPTPPGRRRAPYLIAAAVIVAAAVVGLAYAIGGSGSSGGDHQTISQTPPDQNPALQDVPPGAPEFTAARAGSTVRFSWTYSSSRSDDSFLVRASHGSGYGPQQAVKTPSYSVPAKKGARVCIEIKIKRFDGSDPQLDWSTPGCSS